jgi:hypothetical protein
MADVLRSSAAGTPLLATACCMMLNACSKATRGRRKRRASVLSHIVAGAPGAGRQARALQHRCGAPF